MINADADYMACPHCDLLHVSRELQATERATCARCGSDLPMPRATFDPQPAIALAFTALVALAVAFLAPLVEMSELGRVAFTTLPRAAAAMWVEGDRISAVVMFTCTIAAPIAYVFSLLLVGLGALRSPIPRNIGVIARWSRKLAPWAMPEVMLLATLVTFVKVAQLSQAAPGLGAYATAVAWGLMALARDALHLPTVWSRIPADVARR